jgi:hypothetical protein
LLARFVALPFIPNFYSETTGSSARRAPMRIRSVPTWIQRQLEGPGHRFGHSFRRTEREQSAMNVTNIADFSMTGGCATSFGTRGAGSAGSNRAPDFSLRSSCELNVRDPDCMPRQTLMPLKLFVHVVSPRSHNVLGAPSAWRPVAADHTPTSTFRW